MIPLLQAALLGALTFVEQDVPGLAVGAPSFPALSTPSNTSMSDVNRDGQPDLILPRTVRLQIAGRFPDSGVVRHPENGEFTRIHVENDLFCGYGDARLVCYRFQGGAWSLFWEDKVSAEIDADTAPIFQDLDGDGHAEMLLPDEDRLLVFRLARGIIETGSLDVFPPKRLESIPVHDLWTSQAAPQVPATLNRRFRIAFSGARLTVHESLGGAPDLFEHRFVDYRVDTPQFGLVQAIHVGDRSFDLVPGYLAPCLLNTDEAVDFAGIRPARTASAPWSPPLHDIILAMGGQDERQVLRVKALSPHVTMADFDADGDVDVFVQSTKFLDAPPREVVMAIASQRRIDHTFSVHVHELGGRFSATPRLLLRTQIRFDRPLVSGDSRWTAYRAGALASPQGDFNGDGRADLVVWDNPNQLAVYVNHDGVFHATPDITLDVAGKLDRLVVTDVDLDGRSDIVLLPQSTEDRAPKVFFAR